MSAVTRLTFCSQTPLADSWRCRHCRSEFAKLHASSLALSPQQLPSVAEYLRHMAAAAAADADFVMPVAMGDAASTTASSKGLLTAANSAGPSGVCELCGDFGCVSFERLSHTSTKDTVDIDGRLMVARRSADDPQSTRSAVVDTSVWLTGCAVLAAGGVISFAPARRRTACARCACGSTSATRTGCRCGPASQCAFPSLCWCPHTLGAVQHKDAAPVHDCTVSAAVPVEPISEATESHRRF